jgi:hypothetical protein
MEQFFADIYYSVAGSGSTSPALPVFIETMRLYRRVLAQTTNWASGLGRVGALDRLLRYEKDTASGALTVVTFNHDLLLESVAAKMPRTSGRWCLRSLYGNISLQGLNWSKVRAYPNHKTGCPDEPPFEVLKLHGSMNWLMQSPTLTPAYGTLFPPQRTNRKIWVANRRDIVIDPRRSATAKPGGRSWNLWPLVVPPIYDKQRVTGMRLLQQVWDLARDRIRHADRLVLFGYSLPDADVLARQMLRTAVRENAAIQCVDCINPDASIAMKIREVFDVPVVKLYANVVAFLAHAA